jgi:branched-subunit amino acid ABC-type transport system permease component
VLSALLVGVAGVLIELVVLRRIYRAPELFQLLATFAVVLVIKDIALFAWGPEDLVGPRAPGLSTAEMFGRRIPQYDLLLIAIGPVVLGLMILLLKRTRWGALVRRRRRTARWWARSASTRPCSSPRCSLSARCWRAWPARCKSRASRPRSISTSR